MRKIKEYTTESIKNTVPLRPPEQKLGRQQGQVQAVAPQVAYRRAQVNGNRLMPAELLALQRALGNRQVQRIVGQRIDTVNDSQQRILADENSSIGVQTNLTPGVANNTYKQSQRGGSELLTPSKIQAKSKPQPMAEKKKMEEVNIALHFDGQTLTVSGSHSHSFPANSGLKPNNSHNKVGIDFSEPSHLKKYQDLADLGPIPEGKYYAKSGEVECHSGVIKKTGGVKCGRSFSLPILGWGQFRTRLYESFFTSLVRKEKAMRSGGFFLHEDRGRDGTAGCIGMLAAEDNRTLQGLISHSTEDEIPLTVAYKSPKAAQMEQSKTYKEVGWTGFTKDFIMHYSEEIRLIAKKKRIDPLAVAGVVAWEREQNPKGYWSDILYQANLCRMGVISSGAGIGYGSIHLSEAEKIEKKGGIDPAKNIKERCLRLLNPVWAIRYIAEIMNYHAENYKRIANENIRKKPEILATLYHTGKSPEKALALNKLKGMARKKGKPLPKPQPDEMGRWILDNKKTIESLVNLGHE